MSYEIKGGIPIPPMARVKYPFAKMEVGQSFEFDKADYVKVSGAANGYGKYHGKKFVTRVLDSERAAVWRVE